MTSVSIPVELRELAVQVERFGTTPYLLTTGADARPHSVMVAAAWEGSDLVAVCGARSRENAGRGPAVALLWAPVEPGGYSLIVDGTAAVDREQVRVTPTKAVLHRSAPAPVTAEPGACGSDCVRVL